MQRLFRIGFILGILPLVSALNSAHQAVAVEYTFSRVYKGLTNFGSAINDHGLVAYSTVDGGKVSINLTDGDTLTQVASGTVSYIPPQALSLNKAGFVAFRVGDGGSHADKVLSSDGTTTKTIAATSQTYGGLFSSITLSAVSINDSGTVVFEGQRTSSSRFGAFQGDGSAAPVEIGAGAYSFVPAINNSGAVAYLHYNPATQRYTTEIQKGSQTYCFPDAPFGDCAMPDINNHGTVAYITIVDGVQKVAVGDGSSLPTYIDGSQFLGGLTGGSYFSGGMPDCAVNDHGVVAFMASPATQRIPGIFTGPNPEHDKVIMTGDPLDGLAVKALTFSRGGLNNAGQIVFDAALTDGTWGVWVATPVPEPSSLLLALLGTLSFVAVVRRLNRAD